MRATLGISNHMPAVKIFARFDLSQFSRLWMHSKDEVDAVQERVRVRVIRSTSTIPARSLVHMPVDYVLNPSEMPERLIDYFKHPAAIKQARNKLKGAACLSWETVSGIAMR